MAAPLPTSKQSVDLSSGAKVSRIRRDPPPKVKEVKILDADERDRREVVFGIALFAVVLFVIIAAFAGFNGVNPRNVVAHF